MSEVDNDKKMSELMINFLEEGYPLGRIKDKTRFKRGININGRNFFIPKDNVAIIGTMFNILEVVYAASPEKIGNILEKHYRLKT